MKSLKSLFFALCCMLATHITVAQSWKELDSLGAKLYGEGKYKEATEVFEKEKVVLEKELGKNNRDYALVLNSLGLLYSTQGIYDKAEPLHREGMEIFAKVEGKENVEYASIITNLGLLYFRQGFYNKAEPIYLEAKEIFANAVGKTNPNYAAILGFLGTLYNKQGLYKKALPFYIEAKDIQEKSNTETPNYALALVNLGMSYSNLADYPKAEQLMLAAQPIIKKLLGESHFYNIYVLNNLGNVYFDLGNYIKAETMFVESLQIRKNTLGEKHPDYAIALNNLANLYDRQGFYDKAETLYLEAIQILKNHPDGIPIINNLATIYDIQGLYEKAENLLVESIPICKKLLGEEHPFYATELHNLGNTYSKKGDYDKSENLLLESLRIRKNTLGELHPNYTSTLNALGNLYRLKKQYAKAEPFFIESVKNKTNDIKNSFPILSEKEKKQYFEKNVNYVISSNQVFIIDILQKEPTYPNLPSLLQTALNLQLQTKGLLFSETQKMKKRILASGDTALINQFESWQAVKNSISKAYNMPIAQREKQGIDIAKLENNANELERGLSLRSADFAAAFNPPTVTYQDIQQKLVENEVAIEMIRTEYKNQESSKQDTAYLALILTKTDIKPVLLKNAKDMEGELFDSYRRNINLNREDKESYGVFWKAIAEVLGRIIPSQQERGQGVRLYFSPDGVYNQINLNTLRNPQTGKYLLEEYDIQIVTNLKEITEEKKTNSAKTASLLGRPAYKMSKQDYEKSLTGLRGESSESENAKLATQKTWSDLEYTEKEIKAIEEQLKKKKWKVEAMLGKEAIEERIKKVQSPTILHIATHGYFTSDDKNKANGMLNSGIILAGVNTTEKGENADDGVLTALEATNLDLDQTDLVVLSACETGLGEVSVGEGVYGLQRGFKVAGAKTVLMSLWAVDDSKTQELMNTFYDLWLSGKTKREAFKQAQLLMKAKYKSPYFWGAFVMVGD